MRSGLKRRTIVVDQQPVFSTPENQADRLTVTSAVGLRTSVLEGEELVARVVLSVDDGHPRELHHEVLELRVLDLLLLTEAVEPGPSGQEEVCVVQSESRVSEGLTS